MIDNLNIRPFYKLIGVPSLLAVVSSVLLWDVGLERAQVVQVLLQTGREDLEVYLAVVLLAARHEELGKLVVLERRLDDVVPLGMLALLRAELAEVLF